MAETTKKPFLFLPACTFAGLLVSCWIARAPTSYTGKWPIIGDALPIELNAVYFIVVGPIVGALLAGVIWMLIANGRGGDRSSFLLRDRRNEGIALAILLLLIFAAETFLSSQYFIILAPEKLCGSRPHFDFLWTNFSTPERVTHCMSGTEEINKKAPYYIEPPVVQAWGHILWPLLTLGCLVGAWLSWSRAEAAPKP